MLHVIIYVDQTFCLQLQFTIQVGCLVVCPMVSLDLILNDESVVLRQVSQETTVTAVQNVFQLTDDALLRFGNKMIMLLGRPVCKQSSRNESAVHRLDQ